MQMNTAVQYTPQQETGRFEIYTLVHKGLRAFMLEVLVQVGKLDGQDEEERREVLEKVRGLILLCRTHLLHENAFIHAAMESRAPGSAAATTGDHHEHEAACRLLEQRVNELARTATALSAIQINQLYRQLALFIAENLVHMHTEEIDNTRALWQHYSDAELLALQQQLVASIPPEQEILFLRWMLPHVSAHERVQLLRGISARIPAEDYNNLLTMTRAHLSAKEWLKLTQALAAG